MCLGAIISNFSQTNRSYIFVKMLVNYSHTKNFGVLKLGLFLEFLLFSYSSSLRMFCAYGPLVNNLAAGFWTACMQSRDVLLRRVKMELQ